VCVCVCVCVRARTRVCVRVFVVFARTSASWAAAATITPLHCVLLATLLFGLAEGAITP